MRAVIVPAKLTDFVEFAAQTPNTPSAPPVRVLAIAGKVDGRVIAIGGIAIRPNGVKQAFADIGPEARKYPITLHKAGLATIALAKKHGMRELRAVAAEPKEAAVRWLLRLGFTPVEGTDDNYVLRIGPDH